MQEMCSQSLLRRRPFGLDAEDLRTIMVEAPPFVWRQKISWLDAEDLITILLRHRPLSGYRRSAHNINPHAAIEPHAGLQQNVLVRAFLDFRGRRRWDYAVLHGQSRHWRRRLPRPRYYQRDLDDKACACYDQRPGWRPYGICGRLHSAPEQAS